MHWVLIVAIGCSFGNWSTNGCAVEDAIEFESKADCLDVLSSARVEGGKNGNSGAYCRPMPEGQTLDQIKRKVM